MNARRPSVSVVVCAHTERRWRDIVRAVESVGGQTLPAAEVILIVDHNPRLLDRARAELSGVTVLANSHPAGLSGARNTGVAAAAGDVIAFLDDDASAEPDWLARIVSHYHDPAVLAVGGSARPVWPGSGRPRVFPAVRAESVSGELDWVVGCSYTGQPRELAPVRNLMGCNMSFRRAVFDVAGGFTEGIGRSGSLPRGCEETELCIRVRRECPDAMVLFEPAAVVAHHIDPARTGWAYLTRRCWAEGISKAAVARLVDPRDALATERAYALRVLPRAVLRQLVRALSGDRDAAAGAAAIVLGLGATSAGYLTGRVVGRQGVVPDSRGQADFGAVFVTEVDLRGEGTPMAVPAPSNREFSHAQVLLRAGQHTIGVRCCPVRAGSIDLTGLTDLTGLAVSDRAEERVRGAASVSVIVPTIDGPSAAVRCVKALLDTGYPDLEVVVVDNRPDPANAVQWQALTSSDPRIRLVSESRPGVSYARNAGVAAARGELVAFVDDDIEVDHGWLDTLTAELGDGTVDCATSLVLPATLDTEAQRLFERMKGFGQGFQRRVFAPQLAEHDPGYVFTPGRFGPGGCALWRRSAFLRLGGFDTRLGGGTPALAGEDLHLFLRLARSGGTVVYSPDAIAWHHHSVSWPQVRGRIRGYGTGLSAVYLLHLVQRPDDLTRLARILPGRAWQVVFGAAARRGAETVERADARHRIPRRLVADQLIGVCQGPLALIRSARRAHRLST